MYYPCNTLDYMPTILFCTRNRPHFKIDRYLDRLQTKLGLLLFLYLLRYLDVNDLTDQQHASSVDCSRCGPVRFVHFPIS